MAQRSEYLSARATVHGWPDEDDSKDSAAGVIQVLAVLGQQEAQLALHLQKLLHRPRPSEWRADMQLLHGYSGHVKRRPFPTEKCCTGTSGARLAVRIG